MHGSYCPAVPEASPTRVLILSAPIGEGHDLPARFLAAGIEEERPGTHVTIADGLATMGPFVERVIHGGAKFESAWDLWVFDGLYWLITNVPPARWMVGTLGIAFGGRRLRALFDRERPDVIVSTYPGFNDLLGRLRLHRRVAAPLVSAITDLSALRYWSHPGTDVHMIVHAESEEEVRSVAGAATRVITVRGLSDPRFDRARDRAEARRALDLPADDEIVVVSGGGWGVGDLAGAIDEALALQETFVVVLAGRNDGLRATLDERYGDEARVRVLGFTTEIPDLFAAADALVHSTAGLTVLEAIVRGCPPISYGWGRGHIRANNRAYKRFGLAAVAADRTALRAELRRALAQRQEPDAGYARLPSAASVVLAAADDQRHRP